MIIIVIVTVVLGSFLLIKANLKKEIYYNGPISEYFDGKVFNRISPAYPTSKESPFKWYSLLKRFFFSNPYAWEPPPFVEVNEPVPLNKVNDGIQVYFINHSTLLIQTEGLNIITDPVYSDVAGPFNMVGPKRVHKPGIKFRDLPPIDIVLLSHSHYDHLDIPTLLKLQKRDNPLIITLWGNDYILKKANKYFKTLALGWEESIEINPNIKITAEKAYHWTRRGLFDTNKALWGSFVILTKNHKIFFAGDTAYHTGEIFKDMQKKYGTFDLSFIPIGAYEPYDFMQYVHTSPKDGVLIHKDTNSKKSIGIHFGTFQLSQETYHQPINDLEIAKKDLEVAKDDFITLKPGESFKTK